MCGSPRRRETRSAFDPLPLPRAGHPVPPTGHQEAAIRGVRHVSSDFGLGDAMSRAGAADDPTPSEAAFWAFVADHAHRKTQALARAAELRRAVAGVYTSTTA